MGASGRRRGLQAALAGRRAARLMEGGRCVAHASRCPDFSAGFQGGHGANAGRVEEGTAECWRGSAPDPRGAEGRGSQC